MPRYGAADFPNSCSVQCRFWPAEEPRDYEEKNIAWITPMPGLSQAMPIVVGDLIFTTASPYSLACLDKKSGKVLWVRPNSPYDAATADDRKAKPELFAKMDALAIKRDDYYAAFAAGTMPTGTAVQEESKLEAELDKLMVDVDERYKRPKEQGEPDWWTIPTPVSDGRAVFVFYTRGVSAAYDLKGKRKWIRYERPLPQHHGCFGSPIVADGKFIIQDGTITALDCADGSAKWTSGDLTKIPLKSSGMNLWFASLSRAVIGGGEYALCPGGTYLFRASDGKGFGYRAGGDIYATPIVDNGCAWSAVQGSIGKYPIETTTNNDLAVKAGQSVKMPKESPVVPGFYCGSWLESSPLVHDGLGYFLKCWGALVVVDLATMQVIYEQVLPLDLFQIDNRRSYFGTSATLAGDYIYLMGSTGVMIVIKPGRKYEEVARNRIQCLGKEGRMMGAYLYPEYYTPRCAEYQDCTMTGTPIFEGNRMYFRGFENLYCVEQNVWAFQSADVSSGEAPLTVKFDASKSRAMPGKKVVKYAWDFSDGSTLRQGSVQTSSPQVAANISHTYANAGTYIAKLTVTDDKGATDEAQTLITVTPVDKAPPVIASVAVKGETNVTVKFNEKVEQASAENSSNYAISQGVKVLSGTLEPDSSTVILTTTPLAENVKYELTAGNVRDRARKPNTVADKSGKAFYRFRSPPDAEGFIRNWLRLPSMPLDMAGGQDVFGKEYFPGQKTCAPNDGDKVSVDGKELAWKALLSNDAVINLAYGTKKEVLFCVAYIDCNEDMPDLLLRIGGSHDSSLWSLNGKELIRVNANRGLGGETSVSERVTLKKGRNVLRMEVAYIFGGSFCARFVDKDGNPVADYNVSAGTLSTPPSGQ